MKKIFKVLIVLLCSISLFACGDDSNEKELGNLIWPDNELAALLPIPTSDKGEILTENDEHFYVTVGDVTKSDYASYVDSCIDKGFIVEATQGDSFYYANNKDGYDLNLFYHEDDLTMTISIECPKYKVHLNVNCRENLMFSRYDVTVYVDDIEIGELIHGGTDSFSVDLKAGSHTLLFESTEDYEVNGKTSFEVKEDQTLDYNIHCTMDNIKINDDEEKVENEKVEKPEKEDAKKEEVVENLTVKNCEELKNLLNVKDEFDPCISSFAEKYKGRIIEFDGYTAYVSKHENYNTRFDYLIYAGNYGDTVKGPYFQFENVNYYDLNLKGDNVPDSFGVGLDIHIQAEVLEYNENSGLFKLNPVSITMR